jgi:nucleotide-binding universal stress UspA family protein
MATWTPHEILVPHDGSPAIATAVEFACALAERARARVTILHVTGAGAPSAGDGALTTPRYLNQDHHEWPAWAREFITRACAPYLGTAQAVRMRLVSGAAGSAIVRFAIESGADLIVLAWKGELEGAHAAIMKEAIRNAPCPVVICRARELDAPVASAGEHVSAPMRSLG